MAIFESLITASVLDVPESRCFVGSVEGRDITTAFSFVDGDYVGIYNVATPAAQRSRGYGGAITARVARNGFQAGAPCALLQSSAAGCGV